MPEQVEVAPTSLRHRIGLGSLLSLLMAASSLLLTALLVLILGVVATDELKRTIGQGLAQRARHAAGQLDATMYERYREVQLLARRSEFTAPDQSRAQRRQILDELQRTYPLYAWIGLTDNAGKVLVSSGGLLEGVDVSARDWWADAPKGVYVHDVHAAKLLAKLLPSSGGTPMRFVDLAFPYYDSSGKQAGILGAHLSWNWARQVQGLFDNAAAGAGTDTLIVSRDGKVLYGPDALLDQPASAASLAQARSQGAGYMEERWADGRDYLVGYARTQGYDGYPGLGWVLLTRQPASAAYLPVRRLQSTVALAGLAVALLFTLIGWRAARRVTLPLLHSAQAAREVEQGRATSLPPVAGSFAELETLRGAFNAILQRLQGKERDLRQANLELEQRVAERTADLERSLASVRASEQRVLTILDASQDAFVAFDGAGSITDWNPRAAQIFGWQRGEVLGKPIEQLLQAGAAQLASLSQAAGGQRVALTAWRSDGARFDAELTLGRLDMDGVPAFAAFISDISQRRRIEQELEGERRLLSTVLETIEVAVVACGPHGEATLSNRAARALPPGAIQGDEQSLLRRALRGEQVQGEELRVVAADGSERHLLCNGSALAGADGSRLGAVVAMADVSALEEAKLAVAEKERFLRAVADNNPAAIGYVDRNEIYRFANRSYQTLMGIDPAGMIGRSIEQVLGTALYAQVRGHVAAALRGERVHFEVDAERAGWPRHFMTDYIPDTGAQGEVRGFHIMVLDITARKRAELQQQEVSRAKSAFLANMSHEIRTPMNAVLGIGQLLDRTPLTSEQQEYVRLIRASGSALLALVNDILDLSKIEAGKLAVVAAPFQLDELAEAIAAAMQAAGVGKRLELLLTLEPGLPQGLVGDLQRLRQVALNLVGNAIKFTAEGEVCVHLGASAPGSSMEILQLTVRDSGIGMSGEQLGRLFNPFEQADSSTARRYGGTGLGLSISQQLVELMGGTITVSSEPGRGSEFVVSVPLQLALRQRPEADGAALAGLRVLLVDDHVPTLRYLEGQLRRWGCAVEAHAAAPSGAAGAWDVALVDSDLLDTAGRAPYAGMVLVALNASLDRAPQPGEDAALAKPVLPGALRLLLQGLRQQHASPDVAPLELPQLAALRGARILLVEDNPTNQLVARGVLEPAGAQVTVAEHGQQAVDLVRAGDTAFDLVLMDVQMPVMDGFEATRVLRGQLGLRIPILAMSAGVLETEQAKCLECGMDGFIAKPVDYVQMLGTITSHLARQAGAPQEPPAAPAPQPVPAAGDADHQPGVFSVRKLLAVIGHSPQRQNIVGLVARVVRQSQEEFEAARARWQAGDGVGAAAALHALRGGVGSLGARNFADLTLALEQALRNADQAQVADGFERAQQALRATLAAAAHWLQLEQPAPPALPPDMPGAIAALVAKLQQQDLDALAQFRQLRPHLASQLGDAAAAQLETAIEGLDFAGALGVLSEETWKAPS